MKRWQRGALVSLTLLVFAACTKDSRLQLDRVEVDVDSEFAVTEIGWSTDQLTEKLEARLKPSGLFALPDGKSKGKGLRLKVSLEGREEDEDVVAATPGAFEIAGVLQLRDGAEGTTDEVIARARSPIMGAGVEERRAAAQAAVEQVLGQLARSIELALKAAKKKDPELERDLTHADPDVRNAAIKVLAERKNPKVLPALLEELKSEDLNQARKALGALIALQDPSAVGPIIEASRAKDDQFQREIVFALGELGGDEAEAYLFTVAQGHDEPLMQESAKQALKEMKSRADKQPKKEKP